MKRRSLVWTGIVLSLAMATLLRAAPAAAPSKLAKAKVDAARRTYEVVWKNNKEGLAPFAELAYRWSRRWLEAELELTDQKSDRLIAYQAHRERMRELARITRDRYRNRYNTVEEVTATDYYNAEAEIWIEQAKNK
jgi:site-specific recombinase XerD